MQSRVRFNRVPKKVPEKVPGGFGGKLGQVQQGSGEGSGEGLGGSRRRSRRRFQRRSWCRASQVPEKVPGGFGAEPGQVQHGSGEGSGEAARSSQWPGHPEDSRRRSGRLWCKAKSGSTDRRRFRRSFGAKPSQVQWVPEKAWEALVHSQVRFNRVSEKVPRKVEPDLALHQSLPDLRNFPESC